MRATSLDWGLNPGPTAYKAGALPLSYRGKESRLPPVGVEPTVFRLEGGRVIHCATGVNDPSRDRTEVKRCHLKRDSKPPVLTTRLMNHGRRQSYVRRKTCVNF